MLLFEAIAAEQRAAMDKRFVERSSAAISPLALLSMSSLSSSSSSSSSSLPSVHGGDEDDEDDLLFDRQLDELTVVQDELRRKCSSWIKEAPRGPTAAHGAIGYSGGRGYSDAPMLTCMLDTYDRCVVPSGRSSSSGRTCGSLLLALGDGESAFTARAVRRGPSHRPTATDNR